MEDQGLLEETIRDLEDEVRQDIWLNQGVCNPDVFHPDYKFIEDQIHQGNLLQYHQILQKICWRPISRLLPCMCFVSCGRNL